MHVRSPVASAFAGHVFLAAAVLQLAASPARAAENVVLENLAVTNDTSKIAIRRVELVETNLTKEEATKLFAGAGRAETAALLARLEAKQILIPEVVASEQGKPGAFTLRDFQANDVNKGKASRLSMASIDGAGVDKKGGPVTVKVGALTVDNLELGAAIAALKGGDTFDGLMKASRVASNGFEISGPDDDTPADAPGGNIIKVKLASMAIEQAYDGDLPTRSAIALNGLSVELPKASRTGAQLAAEGYDSLQADLRFGATYDPARGKLAIDDISLDAPKVGSLRLRGELGKIDRSFFVGSSEQRAAALIGADIASLELRFVNAGAFEKLVSSIAKDQKKTPAALIAEWKIMAAAVGPALAEGNPVGAKASEAFTKFLGNPRSLTIAAKAKAGSVGVMELAANPAPAAILSKVDIRFSADEGAAAASGAQVVAQAAPAAGQTFAAAPAKLKGLAAWSALVGNTVSGKDSDGDQIFEYYTDDGRLKQRSDDTVTSGKWALRGAKACILYSGDKEETCYNIEVFGDVATFTDEDGDGTRYTILKGNPKGL